MIPQYDVVFVLLRAERKAVTATKSKLFPRIKLLFIATYHINQDSWITQHRHIPWNGLSIVKHYSRSKLVIVWLSVYRRKAKTELPCRSCCFRYMAPVQPFSRMICPRAHKYKYQTLLLILNLRHHDLKNSCYLIDVRFACSIVVRFLCLSAVRLSRNQHYKGKPQTLHPIRAILDQIFLFSKTCFASCCRCDLPWGYCMVYFL